MATNLGSGASGWPWRSRDPVVEKIIAVGLTSGHAKLHYSRGELNLLSLTSPMLTQSRMDHLIDDQVVHEFDA